MIGKMRDIVAKARVVRDNGKLGWIISEHEWEKVPDWRAGSGNLFRCIHCGFVLRISDCRRKA